MKSHSIIRTRLVLLLMAGLISGCEASTPGVLLEADGSTIIHNMPRYGLNLGGSGTWGAEQLRANVLANPGFEPVLDRTIVIVKEASSGYVVDDTNWLTRPDGFWNGATYDIRNGMAAGRSGHIRVSGKRKKDGLGEFWLDNRADEIRPGDVLVLTHQTNLTIAPLWWTGKGSFAKAPGEPRPGSAGNQSVRLLALPGKPAEILHYLDNIADRAGKLLPVNGKWRLEFWARSPGANTLLHAHFDRGGRQVFLDTVVKPGKTWQRYQFEFEAVDVGPAGVLTLGLMAKHGEVQLDDVYLGEANPGAGGFRQVVVQTLKTLHPGFLRDWQGQLGDTLDNRWAVEQGHQPVRYRPGEHVTQFHYSLPDFLALCAEVGAQPWVVAPTTLNDDEWRRFGALLHQAADRYHFEEIMIEFGNENWNQLFRPGGIPDVAAHTAVADRAFALLKTGSQQDARIHTVLNAQFVNPENPRLIGASSREAEYIAVAPYFLYKLDAGTSIAEANKAAFNESDELIKKEAKALRKLNKKLAVYEVNFHTTLGSAGVDLRNSVVTGGSSGAALARRLLQDTLSGVRQQAVYSFAGFDSYLQEGKGLVRLWGITRDLSVADKLRPTGLALSMLNRVVEGDAQSALCSGKACHDMTTVFFAQGKWMAVVSSSAQANTITAQLPCLNHSLTLELLDGSNAELSNEKSKEVRTFRSSLVCKDNQVTFSLPAYSLAVISP